MPIRDYPPEIQGPMRLVMQLKDLFIDCFNLLEEYRAFLLDASLSTDRQLIEQNLNRNLDEIRNLRSEMADLENRARGHYVRNQELRKYITRHYGPNAFRNRYIIRLIARIERNNDPAPIPPELGAMRSPNSLLGDLNANWVPYAGTMDPERVEIPPEFDLHAARTPEGEEMMSITDLYRAAMEVIVKFLIEMSEMLVPVMPAVTEPTSVYDRAFSWNSPVFRLRRRRVDELGDNLTPMLAAAERIVQKISSCMTILQQGVDRYEEIKTYYREQMRAQKHMIDNQLRVVQALRRYTDCLHSENDRITGAAVKLQQDFMHIEQFRQLTSDEFIPYNINVDTGEIAGPSNRSPPQPPVNRAPMEVASGSPPPMPPDDRPRYLESGSSDSDSNDFMNNASNDPEMLPVSDTNISASGGGRCPLIWRQHPIGDATKITNTTTTTGGTDHKLSTINTDRANEKMKSLSDNLQLIKNLLLGAESVPSGVVPVGTQSVDWNRTSQALTDKTNKLSQDTSEQTSSSYGSQLKSFNSTAALNRQLITQAANPMSIATLLKLPSIHNCSPTKEIINSKARFGQDNNLTTEESISMITNPLSQSEDAHSSKRYPLVDSNVNASGAMLPKIMQGTKDLSSPKDKIAKSTIQGEPNRAKLSNRNINFVGETVHAPKSQKVQEQNDVELEKRPSPSVSAATIVAQVGTTECGTACHPVWGSLKHAKQLTAEELLEEPKRIAISRALSIHRSRLVDTILKADKERLEELITLLVKR